MKLTCDLCGGALQVNPGGQDAACKNCGLCYPMALLREKLKSGNAAQPKPQEPAVEPVTPVAPVVPVTPVTPVEPVTPVVPVVPVTPVTPVEPVLEQFVMPVEKLFAACLTGYVQQGCIGVGERVYINGDYSKPYRLYRFGDDTATTHAAAGEYARLYLVPNRKDAMKQARMITGDPTPTANAYRFNGCVESYFADLLQKNFAEYALQQQVQWPGLNMPVSYMLLKNGHPVTAIFVYDSHDAKARYQAQKAVQVFAGSGIGCTYFYKDYRNDAPYVIDRIRAAMG